MRPTLLVVVALLAGCGKEDVMARTLRFRSVKALPCRLEATLIASAGTSHEVVLANRGARVLRLVVPGDGSEHQLRTPLLAWTVTRTDGTVIDANPPRDCANIDRLREDELFELAPGDTRKVYARTRDLEPGTYDMKVLYANIPAWHLEANNDKAIVEAVEKTSECSASSPVVRVIVP